VADETLRELYDGCYPRLVGQLFAVTGDYDAAHDAVQEAFIRAISSPRRLSGLDNPEAWLRTVAVNVARSRWRRLRRLDALLGVGRTARPHETPSQIPDPERAIALVEPDGFLVVAGELHRLAVTPLFGHYADEFSFAAAEDGVLTGEYDEQDGVSLDLGQTWLPVPKVDGVEYSSAITRPGGRLTRLWYGDGSGATGDSVRLTYIQTSDDQGRAWSAQKVSGEPVRTAVAMSEGTYTATSPDGSFLRSDDGATFARATGPIGRITQMGGHTGEAWAVTDAGQLWVSTDGRGVRWLQIPLPE
jgi:hypothetical protein